MEVMRLSAVRSTQDVGQGIERPLGLEGPGMVILCGRRYGDVAVVDIDVKHCMDGCWYGVVE